MRSARPSMAYAFAFLEGERDQWQTFAPTTTADALRKVLDHSDRATKLRPGDPRPAEAIRMLRVLDSR